MMNNTDHTLLRMFYDNYLSLWAECNHVCGLWYNVLNDIISQQQYNMTTKFIPTKLNSVYPQLNITIHSYVPLHEIQF